MFVLLIGRLTADDFITPDAANKGKENAKKDLSAAKCPHSEMMLRGKPCVPEHTLNVCTHWVAATLLDRKTGNLSPSCTMGKLSSRTKREGGGEHHSPSQRGIRHKVTASPCSSDGQSRRKAFHRRRVYPASTASYPRTQRSCNLHYVRIRHC